METRVSAENDELKDRLRRSLRRTGEGKTKHAGASFHRGDTVNFNPNQGDFLKPGFLETYLLKGWMPPTPPIAPGTRVTAFGSCFAANITRHLSKLGFDTSSERDPDIYISRIGDGLVNVHALAEQFE